MGSKIEAKRRMQRPACRCCQRIEVGEQSAAEVLAAGRSARLAAADQGLGRRRRARHAHRAHAPTSSPRCWKRPAQEAQAAFGDGTLFVEPYIERRRHVEVQIFGDTHGNVVHLFERECSIQRRHQKIIEESPSPALDDALRARDDRRRRARCEAIGYVNAGTVEFLLTPDGKFYFLEVNTRLQVEHPVTECITGLDLVRLQILVAAGEPLPAEVREAKLRGHAIEARLYAEDPRQDYLPSAGTLHRFRLPDDAPDCASSRRWTTSADDLAVLRSAAGQGDRARSDAGRSRSAIEPRACRGANPRAAHQSRVAGAHARASRVSGGQHRHAFSRAARCRCPVGAAGRRSTSSDCTPPPRPHWPRRPQRRREARCWAARPPAGATIRRSCSKRRFRGDHGEIVVEYRFAAPACGCESTAKSCADVRCECRGPSQVRLQVDGVERCLRRARVGDTYLRRQSAGLVDAGRDARGFRCRRKPSRPVRWWRRCRAW